MIGVLATLCSVLLQVVVVTFAQQKACIPDGRSDTKGFCTTTDSLVELCSTNNTDKIEFSSSTDCSEFDGSWCCYSMTIHRTKLVTIQHEVTTPTVGIIIGLPTTKSVTSLNTMGNTTRLNKSVNKISDTSAGKFRAVKKTFNTFATWEKSLPPVFLTNSLEKVISNTSRTSCTPDKVQGLQRQGICSSTDKLDDWCATVTLTISRSIDCSEFDGSWCCYDAPTKHAQLSPETDDAEIMSRNLQRK